MAAWLCGAALLCGCAERAAAPAPDPAAVRRGAALAAIGDCAVCHTADGGRPYAGGRPIPTPFGTIYASNITPDGKTGLGRWSLGDLRRAFRSGTAPGWRQLYPAFPYDHFARLGDGDVADLYAFLRSRTAVSARPPANRLVFPLGFRPFVLGWKVLFLHPRPDAPAVGRSDDWRRGRYLVEALAHCGACHTPHGALGQEEADKPFAGGWAEGWYAPPLTGASPAAKPWTVDSLETYLRTGLSPDHAAAAGPMGTVTRELAAAPEPEVRAIAVYVASLMTTPERPAPDRAARAAASQPQGAALFAGACATCHEAGAPMMAEGRPGLALGTPLNEDDPRDVLQIVLQGLTPPVGRAGPQMPAFADSFTDGQLGELAAYLRARYSDRPPWPGDLKAQAAKARKEGAA